MFSQNAPVFTDVSGFQTGHNDGTMVVWKLLFAVAYAVQPRFVTPVSKEGQSLTIF